AARASRGGVTRRRRGRVALGRPAQSMVSIRRGWIATLAATIALGAPTTVAAHPLHTTLTEVTVDATAHTVRAVVRVFADDFGTALAHHVHTASPLSGRAWDDAASSYLAAAVSIA